MAYWRDPEVLLVCGLGSGFVPRAPGTAGSAAAVILWWFCLAGQPAEIQLLVVALAVVSGAWLTGRVQRRYAVSDPGCVVIDEFAGQWLALLMVPVSWWTVLAGFVLFRFFDILKPWPIRQVESSCGGGFGVMADDLAAGFMAWGVLQFTLLALAAF